MQDILIFGKVRKPTVFYILKSFNLRNLEKYLCFTSGKYRKVNLEIASRCTYSLMFHLFLLFHTNYKRV